MKENQNRKLDKWNSEIGVLESLKKALEEYSALKDEKGEKDKIDKLNAKIANLIDENFWTKLEWNTIKRGKQSRTEGLEKIEKKIKDRQKKIEAYMQEQADDSAPLSEEEREKLRQECKEGDVFYHWTYGEMEVLVVEEDYLYLKILDKKGVKSELADANMVEVMNAEGDFEEAKEFPKSAIGRWLFPDKEVVPAVEGVEGHKIYK